MTASSCLSSGASRPGTPGFRPTPIPHYELDGTWARWDVERWGGAGSHEDLNWVGVSPALLVHASEIQLLVPDGVGSLHATRPLRRRSTARHRRAHGTCTETVVR
jgi:hypothetical protein